MVILQIDSYSLGAIRSNGNAPVRGAGRLADCRRCLCGNSYEAAACRTDLVAWRLSDHIDELWG
jgi:hypothetical protein